MSDPTNPTPMPDPGPPSGAEFARLHRTVEGLIDADLLLSEDGGALLEAIEAARRSLDGGDVVAAHRHTRRFCQAIEALVQSGLLEEAHGRAALDTARRMLGDPAG